MANLPLSTMATLPNTLNALNDRKNTPHDNISYIEFNSCNANRSIYLYHLSHRRRRHRRQNFIHFSYSSSFVIHCCFGFGEVTVETLARKSHTVCHGTRMLCIAEYTISSIHTFPLTVNRMTRASTAMAVVVIVVVVVIDGGGIGSRADGNSNSNTLCMYV